MDRRFGVRTSECLPLCVHEIDDSCALPDCSWTPEEAKARLRELQRQADGRQGQDAFAYFLCDEGEVHMFWTCGYAQGIAFPYGDGYRDLPEHHGWAWHNYTTDPCPYFFPESGTEPEPWPFTF